MLTSRVPFEFLTHRLDCLFYHPDAMKLDQKFRQLNNIQRLSELVDPSRKISAYAKIVPNDVWAKRKLEQFAALGVR